MLPAMAREKVRRRKMVPDLNIRVEILPGKDRDFLERLPKGNYIIFPPSKFD